MYFAVIMTPCLFLSFCLFFFNPYFFPASYRLERTLELAIALLP